VKKGRHRRFEEARALKRDDRPLQIGNGASGEPCAECSAEPGAEHASWCRATETDPWDEDVEG
jgi:hypothetical protein